MYASVFLLQKSNKPAKEGIHKSMASIGPVPSGVALRG